jgi:hypothetical protein
VGGSCPTKAKTKFVKKERRKKKKDRKEENLQPVVSGAE